MTNANQPLVDAIRHVAASVQKAIADGYRSRAIDANDLVEVLLAIADELDVVPTAESELLAAARALLEAREDQMVTSAEWDRLRKAVDALN
ncbi:MAG: hypothetical protein AB7Q45_25655 [Planctomycetaceae bacterium]